MKLCSRCNEHEAVPDQRWCRACFRAYQLTDDFRAYRRQYKATDVYRAKHCAREKVRRAIRSGRVLKPNLCGACLSQSPLQAHHTDYDKPLDVVWLCGPCHLKEHA